MEFIGKLKKKITLHDNEVSIESSHWTDKVLGVPSVKFSYDQIKSVEINEESGWAMRSAFMEFKVDGSHNSDYNKKDILGLNNKNMTENPYVVVFEKKQTDEVYKLRDEILRRADIKKSKTTGESITSGADELKKYADLRDQGILTEDEFKIKKKEILGL